jgi:hypothetical protein
MRFGMRVGPFWVSSGGSRSRKPARGPETVAGAMWLLALIVVLALLMTLWDIGVF